MKAVLLCSTLFCVIAIPTIGELTHADLDKIRLIVNDAEKRIKAEVKTEIAITHTKIDTLDTRLRNVETDILELRGRRIAFSVMKDWLIALCAVAALIVSIIALRKNKPPSHRPHKAPQRPCLNKIYREPRIEARIIREKVDKALEAVLTQLRPN